MTSGRALRRLKWALAGAASAIGAGAMLVMISLRPPATAPAETDRFVLQDVTVINPTRNRMESATVDVGDGRITRIDAGTSASSGHALPEFRGAYVLPGLIDMHAHLPPKSLLALSEHAALMFLAYGVTAIRVVGDTDGTAVPTARAAIAGGAPGPRIFSCGPFIVGGLPLRWPNSVVLERPEQADRVVARLKAEGNVCIKSYEDLDRDKLRALITASRKHGLRMVGHVPHGIDYVEGLVPEVQHFHGVPPPASMSRDHVMDRAIHWRAVDEQRMEEVVESTLRNGTSNTPTLSATAQLLRYRDFGNAIRSADMQDMPRLYREIAWSPSAGIPFWHGIDVRMDEIADAHAKKLELTGRLYRAGAELYLGTDVQQPFTVPGASLQQEMHEFVRAGIPLEEVWAMATWRAAATLETPLLGQLADGAPVDFLILRRDPTRDLSALDTLEAVVVQGRLYRRAALDAARGEWRRHFASPVFEAISMPAARATLRHNALRDY